MNRKIGVIVLLYTLAVMVAFLTAFLGLRQALREPPRTALSGSSVYLLNDEEFLKAYKQESFSLDTEKIMSASRLYRQLYPGLQSRFTPFVIGFCLFLVLSSAGLWIVLKQLQAKNMLRIAKSLNGIRDASSPLEDQPELSKAFQSLQDKIAASMEEFKRLYHYLTHEQKNAVAILRANMELIGNEDNQENLDYLIDSIDDVLTLSENENTAVKSEVNVLMICAEVCDLYRNIYDPISFVYEEEGDVTIYAKERWITRAVSNLLDNAIKYGEGRPVEVSVRNRHHCVIVAVSDHGMGISDEDQSKIFDYRYRVNALKKDGYGIGLSLVSHVCDLSGGFATVESEPGKGSVFLLSFPCAAEKAKD